MAECVEKTLEQTLAEEGEILTVAFGISMLPCIRPKKDILHLVRPIRPVGVHDVILYRRKNGTQILHRVLKIENSGYVLCGDNQYIQEIGVKEEQILGILRGFYRGDRYIDCKTNPCYHIYVKIWCYSLRLRRLLLWLMNLGLKGRKLLVWKKKE